MPMPLEGIRVIDWTIWQQGPVCSAMLGDLGADVIKIEERVGGDPGRGMLRLAGVRPRDRPNFYFEANNRNKRSMTLDLKKPRGARDRLRARRRKSDVFVQNFRKGVAERLGLGYATCGSTTRRLIYASATGYGPPGPDSGAPSFDYLGLARSGIMLAAGEPDMPPLAIAGGIADQMGAIMLAYGVLAALLARERSGIGQEVDASHLGEHDVAAGAERLGAPDARRRHAARVAQHRVQPALEPLPLRRRPLDRLGMLQADRYWADFCRALGAPELGRRRALRDTARRAWRTPATAIADPRRDVRQASRAPSGSRSCKAAGDFIFAVVQSVDDLPDDPQVKANDYVVDFDHPAFGPTQVVGMPVRLSARPPAAIRRAAPEFGQHTEEILTELLGYSWDDVAALREKEVI